jgi:hypothetical protein
MVEARTKESGGVEVAGFARRISHNVTGGFGCRHHASTQRMTTVTSFGRTFEHTCDVASFAGRRGMPAGKRKACGHVIEVPPSQLRICCDRLQCEHG